MENAACHSYLPKTFIRPSINLPVCRTSLPSRIAVVSPLPFTLYSLSTGTTLESACEDDGLDVFI